MAEPGGVWSDFALPNDKDVTEAGNVGMGERWMDKRVVREAIADEIRLHVPQYDPPAPAAPDEVEGAYETVKGMLGIDAPPPPVQRPSEGWTDELRVQGATQPDERVERNRRRLLEGGGDA